jgi:hypothetical protein
MQNDPTNTIWRSGEGCCGENPAQIQIRQTTLVSRLRSVSSSCAMLTTQRQVKATRDDPRLATKKLQIRLRREMLHNLGKLALRQWLLGRTRRRPPEC